MNVPTADELLVVWTDRGGSGDRLGRLPLQRVAVDLLADGRPVRSAALADAAGLPLDEVEGWLDRARSAGFEFDTEGRLVGAALSLRPTRHRFRIRGNDLYTWCGFDALFLPVVLAEPAHVRSSCPVTGATIALDVGAGGAVSDAVPATVTVAIVGREVTSSCATTGPTSAVCSQMPLFASRDAGAGWQRDHPGVAIVGLDAAADLARAHASCCY